MTTYESLGLLISFLNLLAAFGGLGLVYHGIRVMARGAETRAVTSERMHNERMTESQRKHDEWMEESRRKDAESERRHRQMMEESQRRREESKSSHNERMVSLRALIDNQAEDRKALRESMETQNESREALRVLVARASGGSA